MKINMIQIFLATVVAMFINVLFPFFLYIKRSEGNTKKLTFKDIFIFIVLPEFLVLCLSIFALAIIVLKTLGLY